MKGHYLLKLGGGYWEALRKWDEAIELTPTNAILYEIKAQALMELNEVFPAVQMAEKAVMLSPTWWVAYQTLGRTQLGLGELQMAIISFSKALHLNPSERELWEMDLKWVCDLQKTKERNNLDNKEDHNDEEEKETVIISNNAVKAR
ncbi:tetratricopeptide repeat protein 33-like isoform X2 [Saccoglossus kowalevskii]